MASMKMGTNFPAELVKEIFSKVKGHSSIAGMTPSEPIAFTGNTQFTFSLDKELAIVGEGGQKPAGDGTLTPVTIRPIKVLCQARVTDEFTIASEEEQLNILETVTDGFSKTIAKGIDKMIMHGVNPYDGNASQTIGDNCLDKAIDEDNVVEYTSGTDAADAKIEEALGLIEGPTGIILNKTMRSDIAKMTANGARKYPEFAWGATPETLGGMALDSNATAGDTLAYVGDFNALKWGFAKDMTMEVIEYGDPDGAGDLKRNNEVLIRSEAYVGWGILDTDAFAMVSVPTEAD